MVLHPADEGTASDEGADADDSDSPVTRSEEFAPDPEAVEESGIPFWAVDAETERVRLPVPPQAFRPRETTPRPVPKRDRDKGGEDAAERAVTFFDLGASLRAQHRFAEALEAWEKALELAPADPFYRASVEWLRALLRA